MNGKDIEMKRFLEMKKEYIEALMQNGNPANDKVKEKMISKALDCALDIRKFEINLYWKRAAYFWAFIIAIFTAYFTLHVGENTEPYFILGTTVVGFIFSFSWYLVNRGSKFWQNNWEMHVDFLEDEVMGSLYKIVKNPKKFKTYEVFSGYASSVTRINQLLSFVITGVWVLLIYDALSNQFNHFSIGILIVITGLIIIVLLFLIFFFTKSKLNRKEEHKPYIVRIPNNKSN